MAEPTTSHEPDETQVYQPLSGLAVAGFVLALAFAALAVVSFLIALIKQGPLFLSLWTYPIPITGGILGYLAQKQIRQSEGTRAGMKLARWAVGLSMAFGLTCATFSYVSELALKQQANAFLMDDPPGPDSGYFKYLIGANHESSKSKLDRAFLLSLPGRDRAGARPGDEKQMQQQYDATDEKGNTGALSKFRNNPFVVALANTDPALTKVESLAVQSWDYRQRTYMVTRHYRISTPEATIEVPLETISNETAPGEGRKWFVGLPDPKSLAVKRTKLGERMDALGRLSMQFLEDWLTELESGKPFADFKAKDKTHWDNLATREVSAEQLRTPIQKLFESSSKSRMPIQRDPKESPIVKKSDDRLQFFHNFRLTVGKGVGPDIGLPPVTLIGVFVVQPTAPYDLNAGGVVPPWELHSLSIERLAPVTRPDKKSAVAQ